MAYTSDRALAAAMQPQCVGVVHHGAEKSGGADDRRAALDPDDRGVVSGLQPDQQFPGRVGGGDAQPGQDVLQFAEGSRMRSRRLGRIGSVSP